MYLFISRLLQYYGVIVPTVWYICLLSAYLAIDCVVAVTVWLWHKAKSWLHNLIPSSFDLINLLFVIYILAFESVKFSRWNSLWN